MTVQLRVFDPDTESEPARRAMRRADHFCRFVVEAYLKHLRYRLQSGDVSHSHVSACERDFADFLNFVPVDGDTPIGSLKVSEACNADMEEWLLSRPLSNATRRRMRSEVVSCFDWAAKDGALIPTAPFYRSRALRLPVKPRREATGDEFVSVMGGACQALKDVVFFIAKAGARTCEAREALWTDVDWDARCIELFVNKTSRVTGQSRLIGLEPDVFDFLSVLYAIAEDQAGNIFLNTKGKPWTADALARNIRRFRRRTGPDSGLCASMFRKFWAGNAEENGCTDREIATGLGHSGTQLVSWYSQARRRKSNQLRIAEKAAGKFRDRSTVLPDTSGTKPDISPEKFWVTGFNV